MNAAALDRESFRRQRRVRALQEQRERRKICIAALLTAAAVFFMGVVCGSLFAKASEQTGDSAQKYYANIEIQPGDTLWEIAGTYMDSHYANRTEYLNELMSLNHMSDSLIVSGQKIIVPYYADGTKDETRAGF